MKQIIIHIGHGKTGSSYLQSCLALNREKLLDFDVDYPITPSFEVAKLGNVTSGNGHLLFKKPLNIESFSGKSKLLFSRESLFVELQSKDWFYDFLSKYSKNLTIIFYVRNYFKHAFSSWGQFIKGGLIFADVDSYLRYKHMPPFINVLKWSDLSKKYGFKLIIRNYSNHKNNLFNIFIADFLNKKEINTTFDIPEQNKINRSLTYSETEYLRLINFLKNSIGQEPSNFVGRTLVDNFPNLKTRNTKCSKETYFLVKKKYLELINKVNDRIEKGESIKFEPIDDICYEENDLDYQTTSIKQFKILSQNLIDIFLANKNPKQIIDIALKISRSENLDLSDALSLMKIAKSYNPNDNNVNSNIYKWEKELKN